MANIISGIYKIECNEHIYIGQSVNIKARWRQHRKGWNMCKKDKERKPQNRFLQNVFNKYGMENMKFSILMELDRGLVEKVGYLGVREALKPLEQTYMNIYNPDMNIYGASGSPLGYKHTPEACKRMGESRRGRKHSEETKNAIREGHLGKKKSPESVAKSAIGLSKEFRIYHKDLGWVEGRNLTAYARDRGYSPSSLTSVVGGSLGHCHGFFRTKEECDEYLKTYKPAVSVHKGVTRIKGKEVGRVWRVRLGVDGRRMLIGDYEIERDAAEAALLARQVYNVS